RSGKILGFYQQSFLPLGKIDLENEKPPQPGKKALGRPFQQQNFPIPLQDADSPAGALHLALRLSHWQAGGVPAGMGPASLPQGTCAATGALRSANRGA